MLGLPSQDLQPCDHSMQVTRLLEYTQGVWERMGRCRSRREAPWNPGGHRTVLNVILPKQTPES